MQVEAAGLDDVNDLARLLWLFAASHEQAKQDTAGFGDDLAEWWLRQQHTHVAFVARASSGIVGMAWLARVPRVPRPGVTERASGDIQSLFVLPEHRRRGIGTALVAAVCAEAERLGLARLTVQANGCALHLYERAGFAASRTLLTRPSG